MKLSFAAALAAALMLPGNTAFAYSGEVSEYQELGNWYSAYFDHEDEHMIRVGAQSPDDSNIHINIDFADNGTYKAMTNTAKPDDERGKIAYPNQLDVSCEVKVDENQAFKSDCWVADDENAVYLDLGNQLGPTFLYQMLQGKDLRVKAVFPGEKEPEEQHFSLNGFKDSFLRGMGLLQVRDFLANAPKDGEGSAKDSPKPQSEDASYFN